MAYLLFLSMLVNKTKHYIIHLYHKMNLDFTKANLSNISCDFLKVGSCLLLKNYGQNLDGIFCSTTVNIFIQLASADKNICLLDNKAQIALRKNIEPLAMQGSMMFLAVWKDV